MIYRILFSTVFVLWAADIAQAETKIGFVDLPKAVQGTTAGKKAKEDLEGQVKKAKAELDKKEAGLKKMQEEIEKKKAVLSEKALQEKQMELQQEIVKFREEVAKTQGEFQKKNQDLTAPVMEKMEKIVNKISKEKGLSLVVQNGPDVLYVAPEVDLTDEVIKAFEKEK